MAPPGWELLAATDLPEARTLLAGHDIALVLCDRDIASPGWREAVRTLAAAPSKPCVVLLSPSASSELWEQVTESGGYDVLRKPVKAEEFRRTLRAGLSQWESGRQLQTMRRRLSHS
jgi:CheY-like chemotaxis protein